MNTVQTDGGMVDITHKMNASSIRGETTILDSVYDEGDGSDSYDETYYPETMEESEESETDTMVGLEDEDITLEIYSDTVAGDELYESIAFRVRNRRQREFDHACEVYTEEIDNVLQDYFRDPYTHQECCEACIGLGRLIPTLHKVKLKEKTDYMTRKLVPVDKDTTVYNYVTHYANLLKDN
jgi:hypothetical protein